MKKVIKLNNVVSQKESVSISIRKSQETRIISINSKNGMTRVETYQKILSIYRKEY